MTKRRLEIMQRRQVLLAKISVQREHLSEIATHWQPALFLADQALLAVRYMRRHPVLSAGLAGLVLVRRRGVADLIKGGWRIWRAWRYVSTFSKKR